MGTEYLTIKEAAKLLDVHPNTIRNWIREDKLPSIKIGRTIRILKSDIPTYARQ